VIVVNKREGHVYGPPSTGGHCVLKPGANEVPDEYFAGLDAHGQNVLEHLFNDGILDADFEQQAPEVAPLAPEAELNHSGLPEDEAAALEVVKASKDRKELSGWLEQEQREAVFDALMDQLNGLDGGSAKG
jgi:hypothetical protein